MCRCRFAVPIVVAALFLAEGEVLAGGGQHESGLELLIRVALHLPALLLGIGLHEFSHAYVATRLGDPTPEDEGRLSLNPLDHLDPAGSILILAGFVSQLPIIGWGLPVQVRAGAFRNPIRDMLKVAAAGPLMNLVIAGCGTALFQLFALLEYGDSLGLPPQACGRIVLMLGGIISTNLSLAAFNLLPIPPLDGHWVAREYLNADQTAVMARVEPFGFLILYVLMQTPLLQWPFRIVGKLEAALIDSGWVLGGYCIVVAAAWALLLRSLPRFHMTRSE